MRRTTPRTMGWLALRGPVLTRLQLPFGTVEGAAFLAGRDRLLGIASTKVLARSSGDPPCTPTMCSRLYGDCHFSQESQCHRGSYSALHARQIAFANDENKLCFTPLRCKDIAFPIQQRMLNVCDGSAIIRKDTGIETVSVRRFNMGVASGAHHSSLKELVPMQEQKWRRL